jgi:rfaE bifunctional protein nucleotidyltransferase chain/domain
MMFKCFKLKDLIQELNPLRRVGKRIVFTNGCFDILHAGHVRYLQAAKSQGDVLVVGLNSDDSVKIIKDPQRPINPQNQRAEVLAGLWCVDYITIFDEPDPMQLILAIKPNVLVKGADWKEADIIGADIVKAAGGKVVRVEMVADISTSGIIECIVQRYR